MTIDTLERIHRRLKEDEARATAVFNELKQFRQEHAPEDLQSDYSEREKKAALESLSAMRALEEFENYDW